MGTDMLPIQLNTVATINKPATTAPASDASSTANPDSFFAVLSNAAMDKNSTGSKAETTSESSNVSKAASKSKQAGDSEEEATANDVTISLNLLLPQQSPTPTATLAANLTGNTMLCSVADETASAVDAVASLSITPAETPISADAIHQQTSVTTSSGKKTTEEGGTTDSTNSTLKGLEMAAFHVTNDNALAAIEKASAKVETGNALPSTQQESKATPPTVSQSTASEQTIAANVTATIVAATAEATTAAPPTVNDTAKSKPMGKITKTSHGENTPGSNQQYAAIKPEPEQSTIGVMTSMPVTDSAEMQTPKQATNQSKAANETASNDVTAAPDASVGANANKPPVGIPTSSVASTQPNNSVTETDNTTAQSNQSANTKEVVPQIVRHAQMLTMSDRTEVQIRLDPPELGRIQLMVSSKDNIVSIHVRAESSEVRDLVQAQTSQLQAALGDQGIRVDRILVNYSPGLLWASNHNNGKRSLDPEANRRAQAINDGEQKEEPGRSRLGWQPSSDHIVDYVV